MRSSDMRLLSSFPDLGFRYAATFATTSKLSRQIIGNTNSNFSVGGGVSYDHRHGVRGGARKFSSSRAVGGGDDRPIRWGIVGAGRISSDFTRAIHLTEGAVATSVAARSSDSARSFAARRSVPAAYGSYSELMHSPDVDVVYVGTTADNHVELATESILAGKAVVVEKPLALNAGDAEALVSLAREKNVFLMEGMWTRCFPAIQKVRELVTANAVGPIVYAQADFGWDASDQSPDERIFSPNSGGMTLDVGVYVSQIGQLAFPGCGVSDVFATGTTMRGVDNTVAATVRYERTDGPLPECGVLQFMMTGVANTEERIVLQGTKGRIIIDGPAHVPQRIRVVYADGREASREVVLDYPLPEDDSESAGEAWNYPGSIGFVHQVRAVGAALRDGQTECPHFTLDDSIQVARIADEIRSQVLGDSARGDMSDGEENCSVQWAGGI